MGWPKGKTRIKRDLFDRVNQEQVAQDRVSEFAQAERFCERRQIIDMLEEKITALEKKLEIAKEAIKDAIELISSEYCSHKGECTDNRDRCFAYKQVKALQAMEKE